MNWEAVHDAIINEDIEQLNSILLSSPKRPRCNDEFDLEDGSESPPLLHLASLATHNTSQMITLLSRAGMNVNVTDHEGRTALHVAMWNLSYYNHHPTREIVTTLLDLGANPRISDSRGQTVLHILAENECHYDFNGYLDILMGFVDEDERSEFVNWKDAEGKTVLFGTLGLGTFHGRSEQDVLRATTKLLELGCDPTVQDDDGHTILHLLTKDVSEMEYSLFYTSIDLLLSFVEESKRSAFIDAKDTEKKSAIYYAANSSSIRPHEIYTLLELSEDPFLGDPTRLTLLHDLLRRLRGDNKEDSLEAVTKLLELGADPKVNDDSGDTTLHILTKNHSHHDFDTFVDTLLSWVDEADQGAYVNATDSAGKPALFYAMINSEPGRVCKLLDFMADPFMGDPTGLEILNGLLGRIHFGNQVMSLRAVIKLVELGADPQVPDGSGQTALHAVALNRSRYDTDAVIDILLSSIDAANKIGYVNTKDMLGKSAIFYAMKHSGPHTVCKLLEVSADPFLGDPTCATLLHGLLSHLHDCNQVDTLRAITMLLDMGADAKAKDESGQTCLHLLAKKQKLSMKSDFISSLLQYQADPGIEDNEGNLPLHYFGDRDTFDPTAGFTLFHHMVGVGL